jgi:SH3 domain-containing YSC84-like protein 1
MTDFVMILNDASAVKAFSQLGSVTLGGNLSIAAGPVGRNAEASGAANFKAVAPIFSYSKTKGLFAGVSLEGSILIERRDANRKFYNAPVTAKQLLTGQFPAPPAADPLYRILNTRAFSGTDAAGDSMYNDIPIYGDEDDSQWGDDPDSPQSPSVGNNSSAGNNRNRATSVGRGRGADTWRNNFSDDYDDFDDYDKQESRYKQQMYAPTTDSPETL